MRGSCLDWPDSLEGHTKGCWYHRLVRDYCAQSELEPRGGVALPRVRAETEKRGVVGGAWGKCSHVNDAGTALKVSYLDFMKIPFEAREKAYNSRSMVRGLARRKREE